MPKPEEVATLVVRGREFSDWLTVFIQTRWYDAFPICKFTCAERDQMPQDWTKLQFKPGDSCNIYLGGQLAFTGLLVTRQVAYDAGNHSTMLLGKGWTWWPTRSSIRTKTGSFDGFNFVQVARKVLAPFAVNIKIIGAPNPLPYKRLQNEPGEKVWDFLERIARPRGIVLGSDEQGNFLIIGDHVGSVGSVDETPATFDERFGKFVDDTVLEGAGVPNAQVVDQLIEGVNILRCQCIISVDDIFLDYSVHGQTPASDEQHGAAASEQEASVGGSADRYTSLLTVAEQPVWNLAEIMDRAKNEAEFREATIIDAFITVQGWLRANGDLWRAGDDVYVKTPMAMLDMVMKIASVTQTQDIQSGTLTTLELVPPWLLKDRINFGVFRPGVPQEPGAAKSGPDAFQTPPPPDAPPNPQPQLGEVEIGPLEIQRP